MVAEPVITQGLLQVPLEIGARGCFFGEGIFQERDLLRAGCAFAQFVRVEQGFHFYESVRMFFLKNPIH